MLFKTIVAFLMLGVQALADPEAEPQTPTTTTTTRTRTTSTTSPTATATLASLEVVTYPQIRCGSNQVNRQGDNPRVNQEFVRVAPRNSECRNVERGPRGQANADSVSFEVRGSTPANSDCVMQWFTQTGCNGGRSRTEFRLTDQNQCFNTRGLRSFRTVCRRRRLN